jgi:hypothetical protein
VQPLAAARTDERNDVGSAGQYPGDRDLRDGRVLLARDLAQ